MKRDKGNSAKKPSQDVTKFDNKVTINQLQHYFQEYKIDEEDLQLLSELQVQKPICLLKGNYKLSKRQLYRRAKKLTQKGLLGFLSDGKLKHYFVTKEGRKVIDILLTGSEESPESVSEFSSFSDSTELIIRTHAYRANLPIHSRPKSLETLLKRGSRTTGIKPQNMTNWVKYYGWMHFASCVAYVEITTQHVIVRIKDILATNPNDASAEAARIIDMVKAELEDSLSTPAKAFRLGDYHLRVSSVIKAKHHAILLHPLAKKCKKQGYSMQGPNWSVDASKGIPEAEATDPLHATEDCDYELQDLEKRSRARIGVMDNRSEIDLLKENFKEVSELLKISSEVQRELSNQLLSNSQSGLNLNQILQQQQQYLAKILTQQNQQIMTMLSAFQSNLERILGGRN